MSDKNTINNKNYAHNLTYPHCFEFRLELQI